MNRHTAKNKVVTRGGVKFWYYSYYSMFCFILWFRLVQNLSFGKISHHQRADGSKETNGYRRKITVRVLEVGANTCLHSPKQKGKEGYTEWMW